MSGPPGTFSNTGRMSTTLLQHPGSWPSGTAQANKVQNGPHWTLVTRPPGGDSAGGVEHRVERALGPAADWCVAEPAVPVGLPPLVVGLGDPDIGIHVDDRHDPAGDRRGVGSGAVDGPSGVEADVAQSIGRVVYGVAGAGDEVGECLLGFVADQKLAPVRRAVAAGSEGEGPHLCRGGLEWNPGGDGSVGRKRPVMLVPVPGGYASAGFLVQRLVMVEADAAHLEQFGGDTRQAGRSYEILHGRTVPPEVLDLQECPAVGVALGQRDLLGVEFDDLAGDLRFVGGDHLRAEHIAQLDVPVPGVVLRLTVAKRIRLVELGESGKGHRYVPSSGR